MSSSDAERDPTPVDQTAPDVDEPTAAETAVDEPVEKAGAEQPAGAEGDDAARLESEIEAEIRALAAERDTFKDIAQRTLADFDNYKKRVHAQIRDEADRATARLIEALLPVLDAAEAAYVNHPEEVGPLLNVMLGELRKQGLEPLDLEGQPFDPSVAEAVAHEPGEGGEVIVTEVLRSGYRWKDRTLRAAMVRTAERAPAGQDAAPGEH